MLFFIYESAWKGWFFTLFGLSSCDYDDSANMVGIPVVAPKGELGKIQVCGGFKLCQRSCHYNNNNYISFIKSSGGNQYKMWLNNILKVIDWATFVWSLNPQVAGIKGELNYVFLLRILVRYGMADLSSLLYLPCTGLKNCFFSSLQVLLTSWFVTNHWLWVGWLLVFVANFIDCSSLLFMSVSMFSLWNASSYELYLDSKITAIALFWSLSMLVMFFLGETRIPYYWRVLNNTSHFLCIYIDQNSIASSHLLEPF